MGGFTHLRVASHFSAHHGTPSPEQLVLAAAAAGAPSAAITDRDGMYGAIRHVRVCMAVGLAPVVGADLQVRTEYADGTEALHVLQSCASQLRRTRESTRLSSRG